MIKICLCPGSAATQPLLPGPLALMVSPVYLNDTCIQKMQVMMMHTVNVLNNNSTGNMNASQGLLDVCSKSLIHIFIRRVRMYLQFH